MSDPLARGGVRRYLDTVKPEEYVPNVGEVDLTELSLTGLADLYGSDKGTIKHNYTILYERIIEDLCRSEMLHRKSCSLEIAEAGVACGASLRMWANYLPSSRITGYDIRPECADLCRDLKNVCIQIADPAVLGEPDTMFDLFIDDASHIAEQIVAMFKNCWGWVRPGGYYVIEDLRCTYNEAYTQQFRQHFDPKAANNRAAIMVMLDHLMRVVDARGEVADFSYYPQMLVLRKKAQAKRA
jgi:hypothetical protein